MPKSTKFLLFIREVHVQRQIVAIILIKAIIVIIKYKYTS